MTDPALLADRFTVGHLIGSGGMGEVYAGYDQRDARPVAIKRIRRGATRDLELVRRFAREGAILRAAAHPNIVSVLAVIEEGDNPCIVMEYVAGGTLQRLLEDVRRLPVERVLALGLDLSDALARAHRLGVIHRDVKPANILLAEDGTPRLTDFGIASIAGEASLEEPGRVVGTLAYLPPEAWDGEEPDARGDIWSLGVVLYEMLAGQLPFSAPQSGLLLAAITLSDPVPLRRLRPEVPLPLGEAVMAMLARDPARRMGSVRELGLLLERLLRPESVTASTVVPRLPRPVSGLIGREREVGEIAALLGDPAVRLLTLQGAGGSGKTRLAIAAAERAARDFPDGVDFVDLTPLRDPALVLPLLAQAIGVEEDLHRPLVEVLAERLAVGRRLVVLDNFEQVVAAAPDLARLLAAASGLTALVTSRFRLGVEPEHEYEVRPLPPPDPEDDLSPSALEHNPAVALFAERARQANPEFVLQGRTAGAVAEICRRLDGLPLAIELAAARSRVLPPPALLAQWREPTALLGAAGADRAPHQRTLKGTIAWSVDLLGAAERSLFARLAVFVGGWSLDDAHQVVGAEHGLDLPAVVDGLQALIERSLVTVRHSDGEPRYGMLETVREYALGMLAVAPEEKALRERHAVHFSALASRWGAEVPTSRQAEALARLGQSNDNLRAALHWAKAAAPDLLLRLTASMGRFWFSAGHWHEALGWYRQALELGPPADRDNHALVLDEMGRLEMFLGDEPAARTHHEQALALAGGSGNQLLLARTGEGLGEVLLKVGDVAKAATVLEQAARTARAAGHRPTLAAVLTTLATARVGAEDWDEAGTLLTEALDLSGGAGDPYVLMRIHYYRAGLALLREDHPSCRTSCEAGRLVAASSGDSAWACHLDEMLGRSLLAESRWAEAEGLMVHSLCQFHQVGSRSCLPHSFEAAARLRLAMAAARDDGDNARSEAARFLGAADRVCEVLSITMLPVERALYAQTLERVRQALGPDRFARDWEDGRRWSEEAVVAAASRPATALGEA